VNKARLLIVDEHPEVRRALSALLSASAAIDVLGTAQSYQAALASTETLKPSIVVIEPKARGKRLPPAPVEVMVRQFADRHAATIILTSYPEDDEREAALHAGASRYLLKDIDAAGLIAEIEAVAQETAAPDPQPWP
jgi:DNA-binding NarL/FixJ family response regulator